MSKTKEAGISVKDAWNNALESLGDIRDDDPEFEALATPVDSDLEVVDEEEFEVDDDVEDPDSAEGPTKLSDLVEEDEQPDKDSSPTIDLESVVELPDGESKTVKELVDGYLRQSDYTQKTQTLAEERKNAERAIKLYDLMREDTVGTIARLALEAGLIDEDQLRDARPSRAVEKWFKQDAADAKPAQSIDEIVARKVAEALGQNEQIKQMRQQDQSQQIIGELDAIERDYEDTLDDADRRAILQRALKDNNPNLEHVYLKMKTELQKRQAAKQRLKEGSTPAKGGRIPSKDKTGDKPKSVREAWEWAVAQHS